MDRLPRKWKSPFASDTVWFVVSVAMRVTVANDIGCSERESRTRPLAGGTVQTISQPLARLASKSNAGSFSLRIQSSLRVIFRGGNRHSVTVYLEKLNLSPSWRSIAEPQLDSIRTQPFLHLSRYASAFDRDHPR